MPPSERTSLRRWTPRLVGASTSARTAGSRPWLRDPQVPPAFPELGEREFLAGVVVDLIGYPLPGRTFWLALGWRLWSDEERQRRDEVQPLDTKPKAVEVEPVM